jgi:uncharacterized DUF497 family protein
LRFCLVLRLPDGWGYVAWQESAVPSFARYTSRVRFEWNPEKEVRNLRKHGVSFVEASTVFGDALAATISDSKHSEFEVSFITMGMSSGNRLLVVSHTDEEESIRIISARTATTQERRRYESGT